MQTGASPVFVNLREADQTARKLSTLVNSEYSDFTDLANDADYIQLPGSVNTALAARIAQLHKVLETSPDVRKPPDEFILWILRSARWPTKTHSAKLQSKSAPDFEITPRIG